MSSFKRHLDRGRVRPGVGGVERGKVGDHADVGNHHLQIVRVHVWRIRSSILATYWSVISIRVPVGTLRLMVNWPASVRGKNASPSNG